MKVVRVHIDDNDSCWKTNRKGSLGSLPLFLGVANNVKKLRLSTNLKNEKIQE